MVKMRNSEQNLYRSCIYGANVLEYGKLCSEFLIFYTNWRQTCRNNGCGWTMPR